VGAGSGDGYDPYEDVPEWTDEDEERYQARRREEIRRRRRRRRQGVSFAFLVLLVLGAGVAGAGITQGWWEWPFGRDARAGTDPSTSGCTPTAPAVAAPAEVQVSVLNATETRGLAAGVAAELRARGYVVARIGNDEGGVEVLESAQVRHGPTLVADARSVALQIPGAVLVDDGRTSEVVDVVLGTGYTAVTPAEEAAAALAAGASTGCPPSSSPSTPAPTPAPTTG
jgi:hypothetical protein